MAITNFKSNVKQSSDQDDYQRLICTEAGCTSRWSIMTDRPKCSKHQWPVRLESFPNIPVMREFSNDGLAWARKIIHLHKEGMRIRSYTLNMACEALRIENPTKIKS